jgi:hypothetical protein
MCRITTPSRLSPTSRIVSCYIAMQATDCQHWPDEPMEWALVLALAHYVGHEELKRQDWTNYSIDFSWFGSCLHANLEAFPTSPIPQVTATITTLAAESGQESKNHASVCNGSSQRKIFLTLHAKHERTNAVVPGPSYGFMLFVLHGDDSATNKLCPSRIMQTLSAVALPFPNYNAEPLNLANAFDIYVIS